jgi:hypothetical protein
MKIEKIILAIILVSIFACNGEGNQAVGQIKEIENEIRQLKSTNAKKIYLEKILEEDQAVRDGEKSAELMLKYGKDSDEYMEYVKAQWKQDEINLIKIEKYLDIHGYPEKEMGDMATTTPWMVIHHAQGYETRERNFEKVYEAYLKGDIDDGAISFYLGRMYEMKNGDRLRMESPYKAEDEINQLIKELNLEEKKANAQSSRRLRP